MTDKELLQQAKDQVAAKDWAGGWDNLYSASTRCDLQRACDAAAIMAIQSAREEAVKPIREALEKHDGYDTFRFLDELKKLTAPGR